MEYRLLVRQSDDPVTFRVHSNHETLANAQRAARTYCQFRYQDDWWQVSEGQFGVGEIEMPCIAAYVLPILTERETLEAERTRLIMRLAEIEKELSSGNQ